MSIYNMDYVKEKWIIRLLLLLHQCNKLLISSLEFSFFSSNHYLEYRFNLNMTLFNPSLMLKKCNANILALHLVTLSVNVHLNSSKRDRKQETEGKRGVEQQRVSKQRM